MHTQGIPASGREQRMMDVALEAAKTAADRGDIPVGAVIFDEQGEPVASAANYRHEGTDPTGHAEILAIREACQKIGERMLTRHTLVVTLEPCVMCAGVILAARIPTVMFGAWDEKAGAAGSVLDLLRDARLPYPRVEVIAGVREAESRALLGAFFHTLRGHIDC